MRKDWKDDLSCLNGTDILVLSPTPTYPKNQGNRKRVYSVCKQLKDNGARIHFLYYPQDWCFHVPTDDLRKVAQQWDSFHLIPTTRDLQTPSQGEDHTIDEWWDYAIGNYLKWLFSHYYFDAFIVNYTYLSKALEFAPPHVYRILDTHDKFSGRRNLFENQGIDKEYFYTTKEEEAIALNRADLVWAIKEKEATFFRQLTDKPVLTMPHIEPQQIVIRKNLIEDENYLVLGMIGVNNTINLQNARRFIQETLPLFHKYLAPIKIRFAGSMCDGLKDLETRAGIELLGRVESVNDFYSLIDVVIVPMSFSTGLKIKAVEAIAQGLPVIAHKHAFEGIPSTYPYHQCNSFQDMGEYCIELAYDKTQVLGLQEATQLSYTKMSAQVQGAMKETRLKLLKGRSFLVIVLNEHFFQKSSPQYAATIQSIYYFRRLTELILYVDTPITKKQADLLRWHDLTAKVVISPQAAAEANLTGVDSGNISYSVLSLEEVCLRRNVISIWFLGVPRDINSALVRKLKSIPIYVRSDILRAYYSTEDVEKIFIKFKEFNQVTIVNSSLEALYSEQQLIPHSKVAIVPFWRDLPGTIWQKWHESDWQEKRIIILANAATLPLVYKVWHVCTELTPNHHKPLVILPPDELTSQEEKNQVSNWQDDQDFCQHLLPISKVMENFQAWNRKPLFVIDFSGGHLAFAIYGETLRRSAVVIIQPESSEQGSQQSLIRGRNYLKFDSILGLFNILVYLTQDVTRIREKEDKNRKEIGCLYGNNVGWSKISKYLKINQELS